MAEKVLAGSAFRSSSNDFDWLGPGIYFWEANPAHGLEFAKERKNLKRGTKIKSPTVVGAVIELGLCLDMTTSVGVQQVRDAHKKLVEVAAASGYELPRNTPDQLRRPLDCAVIRLFHDIRRDEGNVPVDTVRGVFLEGDPIFDGSGFRAKTHIQICVCNPECIKAVFRVPPAHLA